MLTDWLSLVAGVVIGVGTTVAANRFAVRRDRLVEGRGDVREAQDVLIELRTAFRRRAKTGTEPDDVALAEISDRWDVAASRVADDDVLTLGTTYAYVGGLFAARDPMTGTTQEQQAFTALMRALKKELRSP